MPGGEDEDEDGDEDQMLCFVFFFFRLFVYPCRVELLVSLLSFVSSFLLFFFCFLIIF